MDFPVSSMACGAFEGLQLHIYPPETRNKIINSFLSDDGAIIKEMQRKICSYVTDYAISQLQIRMRECVTDEELSQLELETNCDFSDSDFRSRVCTEIAKELDSRKRARDEVATFSSALVNMQTPEQLRQYILQNKEAMVASGMNIERLFQLMDGDDSPSEYCCIVGTNYSWLRKYTCECHPGLEFRILRLCKDDAGPKLLWLKCINNTGNESLLPKLLSKVYDDNEEALFAAIVRAVDRPLDAHYLDQLLRVTNTVRHLEALEKDTKDRSGLVEKIRNNIVRAKLVHEVILNVPPDDVVTWVLGAYAIKTNGVTKAGVEELLPLFIDKLSSSYWSSLTDGSDTFHHIKRLHETAWETDAMNVAVELHVPKIKADNRVRIGYRFETSNKSKRTRY